MASRKAAAYKRKAAIAAGPPATDGEPHHPNPPLPFPVVAVGASAGGLAAFNALLKALPAKSGMAFVLIQHLEPKHESALAALLSKATNMSVVEVADGIQIEANRVYVIPPNKRMTMRKGALRLAPRLDSNGLPRPIDDFAVALANEQGRAAIGVLLSGTGSDGTQGLRAIKAAGGITFAQEPKTAQWPAMPMSAISAGAADFVLPPKRIAAELARIGRHPYIAESQEVPDGGDLDKLCLILRAATGIDFRLYKQPTFRRRLARRMALQRIGSLAKYAQVLKKNREEAEALADDIFIHVTSFFRNPECFEALRKRVIAKGCTRKPNGEPIRIWAPGCSTGEEVYSLAMILLEELGESASRVKIQIFGTDIQERAAAHARAGIYSEAAVAGVSPARLKRFFIQADQGYQIQTFVRDLCIFAKHDLAKDPPFSRLDLICCRNVLIYMGPVLQKRVLAIFQYALKPGGALFLGGSESISSYSDIFSAEDRTHRIFVRKPTSAGFREYTAAQSPLLLPAGPEPARAAPPNAVGDLRKEAESLLLEHYAPPALIVDSDLHIVHFQGDTSPFLAPATGQPSFHLLKMVRPELVVDLRAAISQARKENAPVHKDGVPLMDKGRRGIVRFDVVPVNKDKGKKQHLMVVFQKTVGDDSTLPASAGQKAHKAERELASTRQQLRALVSEHETALEEMKAANEEILSSNEELQSTNEELETAKEELQSSNEELVSLNEELQHRNSELSVLTSDLNGLLMNLDIPLLVLDGDLRVRRFTPMAGELLNLIPGDVGRPFSNIASTLDVDDLDSLLSKVVLQGKPVEREVSDRNGRRYSMRLRPNKASGNGVDGVLAMLVDIDVIHHALEEAQKSRDLAHLQEQRADSILNSLAAQVAVVSPDGIIIATNDAWKRFARDNGDPPPGKVDAGANYLRACAVAASRGASGAQAAEDGIRDVLEGRRDSFHLEYPCDSPTERRWFYMNVTPLKQAGGGAVIAHVDITKRKLAEDAAVKNEATIRGLLESSPQSVVAVTVEQEILFVNGNTEKMFGYKREELLGQPLSMLVPEEARERHIAHHTVYFENIQSRPMGIGMTLSGLRKDGSTFPVEIALSGLETAAGKRAVAFVNDITERRRLELAADAHTKEVQALAASLLTAQEEERRRVSRELHDQVCQELAALAFDIGGLAADTSNSKPIRGRLTELQQRVVRTSAEARHLAYQLHPSVLDDLGLVASLRELFTDFSKRAAGVHLEFVGDATIGTMPREVASCFYRVAQESLRNIAKHARAKHVTVTLDRQLGALRLAVVDDGIGFEPQKVKGKGGLGLIGMVERVHLVGGKLTVDSHPGAGTRIGVEVALPSAESE